MDARIPVTVLGATGVVGQRFVRRLASHPWFELRHLAASDRSAGSSYAAACDWRLEGPPHAGLGAWTVRRCEPEESFAPVVFSALDAAVAREVEPRFAAEGAVVFSNASAFRMDEDVPLLVPEVNPDHLTLLDAQRSRRGTRGAIVCNPNCTTTVLVMALAPLERAFGIEAVTMTSLQAVSGAGYPGVASLDILANVLPFIRGEEEKVESETQKILGALSGAHVRPAAFPVSAQCHRIPVLDGHTEAVGVRLRGSPQARDVERALADWRAAPQELELPSAPALPLRLHAEPDRPQVRRDVEQDQGMSVHVGRVRACPVLGIKFGLLGHNTERGAAGGSLLNAELARCLGRLST